MSRMPPLDNDKLSPEQKRVYDQIAGKRKTVRGPFPMWLRNPKLAEHANQFGVALRDHSVIGRRIFELCVITVCRAGSAREKRALRSLVHCIGVRAPFLLPREKLSPTPISSPS